MILSFQLEVGDKFLAHITYIKFYFTIKFDYEDRQGITAQNYYN